MWNNIKNKNGAGFTLLELLIVIAVIAIIAAVAYVAIDPAERLSSAKDAQRIQEINSIAEALRLYSLEHGGYPEEADGYNGYIGVGGNIDTLLADYMGEVPDDPEHQVGTYYYYFDAYHICYGPGHSESFVMLTVYNFESEHYQDNYENLAQNCAYTWGGEGGSSPAYVIKLAPQMY